MSAIDAILEALSHAGELFVGTMPEGQESKRAAVLRFLIIMTLLVLIMLPLYFAFR
jgi:hypothetical protein